MQQLLLLTHHINKQVCRSLIHLVTEVKYGGVVHIHKIVPLFVDWFVNLECYRSQIWLISPILISTSLAVLVLDIAGHCDCLMPPDGLCGCSDVLLCIIY